MKNLTALLILVIAGCLFPESREQRTPRPLSLGMTLDEVRTLRTLEHGMESVSQYGWTLETIARSSARGWHYTFERENVEEPYVLVSAYYVEPIPHRWW